jgi:uncharacterized protein with NRDE domain
VCLILLAYHSHPRFPLVVAANRDEWFQRPTAPARFWSDHPEVLAGRDLEQGGTWLGITRRGRFAALTNYRDPANKRDPAPSRGALPSGFLIGDAEPLDYVERLRSAAHAYNGFNLFAADRDSLAYLSSPGATASRLGPGIYGLSNGVLDEPWPKVTKGKTALERALSSSPGPDALFTVLKDHDIAPDHALPSTGVSLDWERRLSAMHILSEGYGTRSATVVLVDRDGDVEFVERTFDAAGSVAGEVRERFRLAD